MSRLALLQRLLKQILLAIRDRQWEVVAQVDRELNALLQGFAGLAPDEDEQAVLARLREAWRSAEQQCRQECERLEQILRDMGAHQEARMAYALTQSYGEDGA